MKRVVLLLLAVFSTTLAHSSQYFYFVDFSSPLHQTNQPVTVNDGPQTPSYIVFGSPTVVSTFGHLTNQPLVFKGLYYEQIQFNLGYGVPDYFIEFDFETHNLDPSLFAFTMLCDTPYVQNFSLHGLGAIEVPPNYDFLPDSSWGDDLPHHLRIGINLIQHSWTLQLDSRTPETGGFNSFSGGIQSIRFNLSAWRGDATNDPTVQIAVDNLHIGTLSGVTAPHIACPDPQVLECSNGTVTTLSVGVQDSSTNLVQIVWTVDDATYQTNTLPAGAALTPINVTFAASFGLGEHTVVVSASNGEAPPVTCSTTVTVRDTTPPTITCPPDIIVSADFRCSARVRSLGYPMVSDNCGILSVTNDAQPILPPPPRPRRNPPPPQRGTIYPLGTNLVTWTVTDTSGNTNSCTQRVIVRDTTPPTIQSISATPNHLWPPNGRMIPVTISLLAFDECGTPNGKITAVHIKGSHSRFARKPRSQDVEITGDLTLRLRARERESVYVIDVVCTDGNGNSSMTSVEVPVLPDPNPRDPR